MAVSYSSTDPNMWTREDVKTWINWAKVTFNLTGNITVDMLPASGVYTFKLKCLFKFFLRTYCLTINDVSYTN